MGRKSLPRGEKKWFRVEQNRSTRRTARKLLRAGKFTTVPTKVRKTEGWATR